MLQIETFRQAGPVVRRGRLANSNWRLSLRWILGNITAELGNFTRELGNFTAELRNFY